MNLEWDESKRLSNIKKHKLDFVGVEEVFDGYTVSIEDSSVSYGEQRFITFGVLATYVVVIVHTEKDNNIRVISIRKATKNEERNYYAAITN